MSESLLTTPENIIVADMTKVLRAQGNIEAQGTVINTSENSPVAGGSYLEIPQSQVSFMAGCFLFN